MPDSNTAFGPPPLQTPITADTPDQFGIPHQLRTELPATGRLNTPWAAWFNKLFEFLGTRNWVEFTTTTSDLTGIIAQQCSYSVAGKTVFLKLYIVGTGTGFGFVTLTLPPGIFFKGHQIIPSVVELAGGAVTSWTILTGTTVTVELFSGSFTGLVTIHLEGAVEAQ